jgi:hypothetical protein
VPGAHVLPPSVLDVPLEFYAQRSVVPKTVHSTVNLTGLKHKTASLAKRDEFFHLHDHCVVITN